MTGVTLEGGSGPDSLTGGLGDDSLIGGGGQDTIRGFGGDDVIYGGDGGGDGLPPDVPGKQYDPPIELTEQLYGGDGNDQIDGGDGEESMFGDDGDDTLYAGAGHDYLVGGAGNDFLDGGEGLDQIFGGAGNDVIIDLEPAPFGSHGDGLYGDAGDDLLVANDAANVLIGGSGSDTLLGGKGDDVLVAGTVVVDADKNIVGGTVDDAVDRLVFRDFDGNDSIYGFQLGLNGDILDFSALTNRSIADLYIAAAGDADGNGVGDTVIGVSAVGGVYHSVLMFNVDYAAFIAVAAQHIVFGNGPLPVQGVDFTVTRPTAANGESLAGGDGWDRIAGYGGNDTLAGGASVDTLDGGTGNDLLIGGAGADFLIGGQGFDTASYADSPAAVTVNLRSGSGIGGDADGDVLTGIEGVLGSTYADVLTGHWGANRLDGGDGNDTLSGGADADTLTGGSGRDVFAFAAVNESGIAANRDLITDFQQGLDLIDLSGMDANVSMPGHQAFMFVTAGSYGAGMVRFSHVGSDTYVWADLNGGGSDFSIRLTGHHDLTAADFTDATIGAIRGTDAPELLIGTEGSETLLGLGGADTLDGGLGSDTLTGGLGADVFAFDATADSGTTAMSRDRITDFEQGVDLIDLSGFDANTTVAGHQGFTWIRGTTDGAGTLRYEQVDGNTYIWADVDGGGSDFSIRLDGLYNLTAADFTDASIDVLRGTSGADILIGTAGSEILRGLAGADTLTGGSGTDVFDFDAITDSGIPVAARDLITDFEQGVDLIDLSDIDANTGVAGHQAFTFVTAGTYGAGMVRFSQSGGDTYVWADVNGGGSDFSIRLTGLHNLTAADFTDATIGTIRGTDAADILVGTAGSETLRGLLGGDTLTGGLGADVFDYDAIGDSKLVASQRDLLTDFQPGIDRIDLSDIDANMVLAGDQAFEFIESGPYGIGKLRYSQSGGDTYVWADVDGGGSDFNIRLTGLHDLTAADFIL